MPKIKSFALIIGAMKCGTTSLYNYLVQHPQVAGSSDKEPNFFASDGNWAKGLDWYQALWDWNPTTHKVALEASTDYTKLPAFPNAAKRIATVNAQFKFIYIMRNPIDRIESHYNHWRAYGSLNHSIEQSLAYMINVSRYATQLKAFYEHFPVESILLLDFNDLKQQPHTLIRNVCQFLEIDLTCNLEGLNEVHNRYRPLQKNHPAWEYLRGVSPLKAIAQVIPDGPKGKIRQLLAQKPLKRFTLSVEHRAFILQELREDLEILNTKYGFDTSDWNIPEPDPNTTKSVP